jgi:hypothetical protein
MPASEPSSPTLAAQQNRICHAKASPSRPLSYFDDSPAIDRRDAPSAIAALQKWQCGDDEDGSKPVERRRK